MKAIILAAGDATRLSPLAENEPKCLFKVGDKSILDHQIQNLKDCGIKEKDIVIVIGHCGDKIENALGDSVECIYNREFATTDLLYSLWCAKEKIRGEEFIYLEGDLLFDKEILKKLLAVKKDICLVVEKKRCTGNEMRVKIKNGLIKEINQEMPYPEAYGEYIGITKFSPRGGEIFFKEAERLFAEGHTNIYCERVIDNLEKKGHDIHFVSTEGLAWMDVDFPGDLERARTKIWYINREIK